jgi:hypothetical protein
MTGAARSANGFLLPGGRLTRMKRGLILWTSSGKPQTTGGLSAGQAYDYLGVSKRIESRQENRVWHTMKEKNAHSRIARKRPPVNVPLYALKTSDAVKIISGSPRRLEEFWDLFEDRDRTIRQRAAAALAELVCLKPAALARFEQRIRDLLMDESAYVRWHAVYAVGCLIGGDRARMKRWIPDLTPPLEDQNSIVRSMAANVLARVAARDSQIIVEAFQEIGQEVPGIMMEALKKRKIEI